MDQPDAGALFALPPEEFVAARDALAKRLRAEGDRDGAQAVRGLRRPTVPAWAVNQLARSQPDEVDVLVEAGERVRLAQAEALSGRGAAGLREASAQRRAVVERLADRAARILVEGGRDPEPHRSAIVSTLEAATLDDEAAGAVRAGTLSAQLVPPSGLDNMTALMPLPSDEVEETEERPEEPAVDERADEGADERAELEEDLRRARESAEGAAQLAGEADRDAQDADREAGESAGKVDALRGQLAEAERRAQAAILRLHERAVAATRARQDADERDADARRAQERLDRAQR